MFIDIYEIAEEGLGFDELVEVSVHSEDDLSRVEVVEARLEGGARPGKRGVDLRSAAAVSRGSKSGFRSSSRWSWCLMESSSRSERAN